MRTDTRQILKTFPGKAEVVDGKRDTVQSMTTADLVTA